LIGRREFMEKSGTKFLCWCNYKVPLTLANSGKLGSNSILLANICMSVLRMQLKFASCIAPYEI
jgi:hypothetical protein